MSAPFFTNVEMKDEGTPELAPGAQEQMSSSDRTEPTTDGTGPTTPSHYTSPFGDVAAFAADLFHEEPGDTTFQLIDAAVSDFDRKDSAYHDAGQQLYHLINERLGKVSETTPFVNHHSAQNSYNQGPPVEQPPVEINDTVFGYEGYHPALTAPGEGISGQLLPPPPILPIPSIIITPPSPPQPLYQPSPRPDQPRRQHPSSPPTKRPPLHLPPHSPLLSPPPTWRCPQNDMTIPTTDPQRQFYASHLLSAINNLTNIIDKPTPAFHKHWLASPPFYTPTHREHLAWTILPLTTTLHTSGPASIFTLPNSFDRNFSEDVYKTRAWTFRERVGKICALLAASKARCQRALGGSGVLRIVGCPEKLLKMARGDSRMNERRQEFLEVGREVLMGEIEMEMDGEGEEEGGMIG
ncbi:hypothetical protein N0V83_009580 [Neocucurbitaria cava]|uniref:Uncharacterized protein n=1 Tax=Neocucurbitaria cava TaxID=798079 RepID=A0A9W8Y0I4_9PLEO|nr:hypothetical protein N0V83_009580 [Neocucurbitaria cava]